MRKTRERLLLAAVDLGLSSTTLAELMNMRREDRKQELLMQGHTDYLKLDAYSFANSIYAKEVLGI